MDNDLLYHRSLQNKRGRHAMYNNNEQIEDHSKLYQTKHIASGSSGSNKFDRKESRSSSDGAGLFPSKHDGVQGALRRHREAQGRECYSQKGNLRRHNRAHERPRRVRPDGRGLLYSEDNGRLQQREERVLPRGHKSK
eukprot:7209343-Heterocapsa_arctica.AAC.1